MQTAVSPLLGLISLTYTVDVLTWLLANRAILGPLRTVSVQQFGSGIILPVISQTVSVYTVLWVAGLGTVAECAKCAKSIRIATNGTDSFARPPSDTLASRPWEHLQHLPQLA